MIVEEDKNAKRKRDLLATDLHHVHVSPIDHIITTLNLNFRVDWSAETEMAGGISITAWSIATLYLQFLPH